MLGMFLDKVSKHKNQYPRAAVSRSDRAAKQLLTAIESGDIHARITPQMLHHEIVESMWRDKVRIPALLKKIKLLQTQQP